MHWIDRSTLEIITVQIKELGKEVVIFLKVISFENCHCLPYLDETLTLCNLDCTRSPRIDVSVDKSLYQSKFDWYSGDKTMHVCMCNLERGSRSKRSSIFCRGRIAIWQIVMCVLVLNASHVISLPPPNCTLPFFIGQIFVVLLLGVSFVMRRGPRPPPNKNLLTNRDLDLL